MADPCLHEHQVLWEERERERERERDEEEFLFHRFNPYTRTGVHARSGHARACAPQRAPALFISWILALLQIRKKKRERERERERERRASAPVLWPTISNYSALLLPTFLSVAHSDPPPPPPRCQGSAKKKSETRPRRDSRGNWSGTDRHLERGRYKCVVATKISPMYSL
jgi:hypothetical protein